MYEQSYNNAGIPAIAWLVILAIYGYFAWSQFKIAQKVGCADRAWWSFIPVMNTFLLIRMAAKEWWWFLFLFVPVVNVFVFAILWMETARASGHSPLWGFLVLIPFLNFVAMGDGFQQYRRPSHRGHSHLGPVRPQASDACFIRAFSIVQ